MKALLAALAALLLTAPAAAQEAPAQAAMDLWCGLAFVSIAADLPGDARPEHLDIARAYGEGGAALVAAAKAPHLASGFTEQSFAAHVEALRGAVRIAVNDPAAVSPFSFEECRALLARTP